MRTKPPKYETPEQIIPLLEQYFKDTAGEKLTLTGLCLALEITKPTMLKYRQKEGFSYILDMAMLRIEHGYEIDNKKHGRSGSQFALKNFGWTDKQEVEHSGNMNIVYLDKQDEEL